MGYLQSEFKWFGLVYGPGFDNLYFCVVILTF
jgi:hypothetical protein